MAAFITFKPEDHYESIRFTGTGSDNNVTTNFQPDATWCKKLGSGDHYLTDAVRGVTKVLYPNDSGQEDTNANAVKGFGATYFTVGSEGAVNGSGDEILSWSWKAPTTTIPTGGTITPTGARINTTTGVSIIGFTGTGSVGTIPHGLSSAPKWTVFKEMNGGSQPWFNTQLGLGGASLGSNWNYYNQWNDTMARSANSGIWNNTAPTDTLVSVGSADIASGQYYILYSFAEVKGFSKFGYYSGNSSTDGPFIYCGFRPSLVYVKEFDQAEGWIMWDKHMSDVATTYANPIEKMMYLNTNGSTNSNNKCDLLSNGFKIRSSHGHLNDGGFIYTAFADQPIVGSDSTPGTAR